MKDAPIEFKVCAVTVTYGSRRNFVEQVLRRLLENKLVAHIVLVDNGSSEDYNNYLSRRRRVTVVRSNTNRGSAWGFASGIEVAVKSQCDFIWLLDDDNLPERDALRTLFDAFKLFGSNLSNTLVAFRDTRPEQLAALATGKIPRFVQNSFLSFHSKTYLCRLLASACKPAKLAGNGKAGDVSLPFPIIEAEFAPYGGLLFHKSWVDKIGLPNEALFTYGDDHEYTSRIIKKGGRILLCAPSKILDLDVSWHLTRIKGHPLLNPSSPSLRVYLSVRNGVWLEKGLMTHRSIYMLNVLLYSCILLLKGVARFGLSRKFLERLRLLILAFANGWRGNLGEPNNKVLGR